MKRIVIAAARCMNSRRSIRPCAYSSYRSNRRWSIFSLVIVLSLVDGPPTLTIWSGRVTGEPGVPGALSAAEEAFAATREAELSAAQRAFLGG